jgi:cytochrome c556
MHRMFAARLPLAAALVVSASALAQSPSGVDGPGWTGATHPHEVIVARQALMAEIERLMRPIDGHAAGDAADAEEIRGAAESIAAMLLSVPHLFPPTTNLYDPAGDAGSTLALPAVWQDFAAFYALSSAAASAAAALADTPSPRDTAAGAARLRASCDACHALYLRPYSPAGVSSEDLDFDFDSLFPPD